MPATGKVLVAIGSLLALVAGSSNAHACFPCWMWGGPNDIALKAESWPLRNGSAEIPILRLAIVHPYGIRELDIRRAFDTAYYKQSFASTMAKNEAYTKWKATIGWATTDTEGTKSYTYRCPDCQGSSYVMMGYTRRGHIEATLFSQGLLTFSIAAPEWDSGKILGRRLGLERESGAGFFARMFVALGGKNAVSRVKANWVRGSSNYETFSQQLEEVFDPLAAANATFTGKMVGRFYGMSAAEVYEMNKGISYVSMFLPPRQQMLPNPVPLQTAADEIKDEDIPPLPDDEEETGNRHQNSANLDDVHELNDTVDIE